MLTEYSSSGFIDPDVVLGFRITSFVTAFVYLTFSVIVIVRMVLLFKPHDFCSNLGSLGVLLIPLLAGFIRLSSSFRFYLSILCFIHPLLVCFV